MRRWIEFVRFSTVQKRPNELWAPLKETGLVGLEKANKLEAIVLSPERYSKLVDLAKKGLSKEKRLEREKKDGNYFFDTDRCFGKGKIGLSLGSTYPCPGCCDCSLELF